MNRYYKEIGNLEEERKVKLQEAKGYHAFASAEEWTGSYGELLERVSLESKENYFKLIMKIMNLKSNERILDCGAGMCWTSYIFSQKGCDVVAIDMNPSEICGIGTVKTYHKVGKIDFDVVLGDCEHRPFKEGSFDIAFCNQTLHHAYNLNKMIYEIGGGVKRGGLMIAANEHIYPLFSNRSSFLKQHPAMKFGVNEQLFTVRQYKNAFRNAGFRQIDIIPNGFENNFERRRFRRFFQLMVRVPFIGEKLVKIILLSFSRAGTTVIIHGVRY